MVSSLLILYFLQEIHNGMLTVGTCRISLHNSLQIFSSISLFPGLLKEERKSPEEIEWFLEDLFLGSQWSIILGYRRLSVKFHSFSMSITLRMRFPTIGFNLLEEVYSDVLFLYNPMSIHSEGKSYEHCPGDVTFFPMGFLSLQYSNHKSQVLENVSEGERKLMSNQRNSGRI